MESSSSRNQLQHEVFIERLAVGPKLTGDLAFDRTMFYDLLGALVDELVEGFEVVLVFLGVGVLRRVVSDGVGPE